MDAEKRREGRTGEGTAEEKNEEAEEGEEGEGDQSTQ